METRELYKEKYLAQIHEWAAKLDVVKARSEKLTAKAKLDAQPHIEAMHTTVETAKARARDIASTTDDRWEEVKKGLDHGWHETVGALQGAYDAVMSMDGDRATSRDATPPTTSAPVAAKRSRPT